MTGSAVTVYRGEITLLRHQFKTRNMSSDTLSIEQVATFLRSHPEFFEAHPDVLLNIEVPHPHGGRTVSIPERQLIATREKVRLLESKLAELIKFGQENDALSDKVHTLALRLTSARAREQIIDTLYLDLLDSFNVPHVVVRLWNVDIPKQRSARISSGCTRTTPIYRGHDSALCWRTSGL
ncbi:MAG: DUF484 family protein [Gammaproteobacteria bacterium]|nr:DUF484 family protein [Gammaproteobacteria bacterium]